MDGLDVVRKISRLPSNQQTTKPHYKPLKDVHVRKVTIAAKEKEAGS